MAQPTTLLPPPLAPSLPSASHLLSSAASLSSVYSDAEAVSAASLDLMLGDATRASKGAGDAVWSSPVGKSGSEAEDGATDTDCDHVGEQEDDADDEDVVITHWQRHEPRQKLPAPTARVGLATPVVVKGGSGWLQDTVDPDGGEIVVVDDVRSALLDSSCISGGDDPCGADNGRDVRLLDDADVVHYSEGTVLSEDEEERYVAGGRDMFKKSRNHAMIWGSARSAGARSIVSVEADAEPPSSRPRAADTPGHIAHAPSHASSLSAASTSAPSSSPRSALTTTTVTPPSSRDGAAAFALAARAASDAAAGDVRAARALAVLLAHAQPGALAPYQLSLRAAAAALTGESPAVKAAAEALADACRAARQAQASAPRALPPVDEKVELWGGAAMKRGKGKGKGKGVATFASAYSFGHTVAIVGALLAMEGVVCLKQAPRAGRSAADGAALDVVLDVTDPASKLAASATVAARADGTGVDVKLRCVGETLLSKRKRRRAFADMCAGVQGAWRSVGWSAGLSAKQRAAAALVSAQKARGGVTGQEQLLAIKARRHTLVV